MREGYFDSPGAGFLQPAAGIFVTIAGATGGILDNNTSGFWTSNGGFIANSPANGFRGAGATFDLTGSTNQFNIGVGSINVMILRRGTVSTADATPTPLADTDIATASGDLIYAEAEVTVEDSLTVAKTMKIAETWMNNAGTLTRRGTQTIIHDKGDAGVAAATVTFVASGTNLRLQVTGIAATTIDWKAVTKYVFG